MYMYIYFSRAVFLWHVPDLVSVSASKNLWGTESIRFHEGKLIYRFICTVWITNWDKVRACVYVLRLVCIRGMYVYMHTSLVVCMYKALLFKSRNRNSIQMKTKWKISRPKFHALSNVALDFDGNLILCTGKWIKIFTETTSIQPPFLAYGTQLQVSQVHRSKERKVLV
jgi:hypothetical protein